MKPLRVLILIAAFVAVGAFIYYWFGVGLSLDRLKDLVSVDRDDTVLRAVKVERGPKIDGFLDHMWAEIKPITVEVKGGAYGEGVVFMRSLYTDDEIFFHVEWDDDTQSLRRTPWRFEDGRWQRIPARQASYVSGQEPAVNGAYQDMLAIVWRLEGVSEQRARKEILDISPTNEQPFAWVSTECDVWQWKAVDTGPVGQMDDLVIKGRKSESGVEYLLNPDPKESGGYSENMNEEGTGPAYISYMNSTAPPYWIKSEEKISLQGVGNFNSGDEVPSIIVSKFVGDRGDIEAMAIYEEGRWSLEIKRARDTGSENDVRFADGDIAYPFSIGVFDNDPMNHSRNDKSYYLVLER